MPLAWHTVHFVHFSVKEFLLRSGSGDENKSRLQKICFSDSASEHDRLARLCLQYLCYDVFGKRQTRTKTRLWIYPFLSYAARIWYKHALYHNNCLSEDTLCCVQKLLDPTTSNWILWSEVLEKKPYPSEYHDSNEDDVTSDATSSDLGSDDSGCSGNVLDSNSRSEKVVRAGARASLSAYNDQASLSSATKSISDSIIEDGRSSGTPKSLDWGPIYYASLLGLTEVVKLLRMKGLDCMAPGRKYGFPLQTAVIKGHRDTVAYLIEHGASPLQSGGYHGSVTFAALASGSEDILRLLLSKGADPSAKNPTSHNPLYKAVLLKNLKLVSLLLRSGADPNDKVENGDFVLYQAIYQGHEEIA